VSSDGVVEHQQEIGDGNRGQNVAIRTLTFHKYRIMQNFSLANNSELLRFAIKQRVIEQH